MPVFLDFPIEFFRHPLELHLPVDGRDAVDGDAVGEGSLSLARAMAEVDSFTLPQRAWVSLDVSVRIACVWVSPA